MFCWYWCYVELCWYLWNVPINMSVFMQSKCTDIYLFCEYILQPCFTYDCYFILELWKKTVFRLTIIKCYMSWITDNIEAINNHSCMWQSHIITPSLAFCSIMLLFCFFFFYLSVWAIKLNRGVSVFMVCFICEPYNVTNVNVQIDWFSCSDFLPSAVNNISH